MKYIFLDFEMNAVARNNREIRKKCKLEIIEFGAVMLDEKYQQVDHFKAFVRPEWNTEVYQKYTDLTGITTGDVISAQKLQPVLYDFAKWCASKDAEYTVYAWSENDLRQLKKELEIKEIPVDDQIEYMTSHWVDFQAIYDDMLGLKSNQKISLSNALNAIGMVFEGKMHDALFDAENTAELFRISQDKVEFEKMRECILNALRPSDELTFSLGSLIHFEQ